MQLRRRWDMVELSGGGTHRLESVGLGLQHRTAAPLDLLRAGGEPSEEGVDVRADRVCCAKAGVGRHLETHIAQVRLLIFGFSSSGAGAALTVCLANRPAIWEDTRAVARRESPAHAGCSAPEPAFPSSQRANGPTPTHQAHTPLFPHPP